MPTLRIRWSEPEARKPYARPLMVAFEGEDGVGLGAIAVSGADLLYYRQFQVAVLNLAGELFADPEIEAGGDPQRAWLDRLGQLMPPAAPIRLRPSSTFDNEHGRAFHLEIDLGPATPAARIDAAAVFEYQEVQAAVAHQSGCLYRDPAVEAIDDPGRRQAAWSRSLAGLLDRPAEADAMAASWPWRPVPG